MSTPQTIYECGKCGAQFPKWLGRCSGCGAWGSLVQSDLPGVPKSQYSVKARPASVLDFSAVNVETVKRYITGLAEFDRVLGGGIVPGSLVLLGGDPGIGKSTLLLQIIAQLSSQTINASPGLVRLGRNECRMINLYVSAEESAEQVKLRFDRLGLKSGDLKFLSETDIDIICATIEKVRPGVTVIDSIQTVYTPEADSELGSMTQVRVSTVKLMETAKKNNLPIFIVGHVTKEGTVAGPKTLEHLVDTVLYLEGDRYHDFRILRAVKNRFGSVSEVGIFEMAVQGLVEVKNPSEKFLSHRSQNLPGSLVTCIIEGSRPFLVEVQALVSKTSFGYPQRKSSGFDLNRLQLLIAVLEKRLNYNFANQDAFINVSGGLKIKEPACDLAICLALISALKNQPVKPRTVALGEVALTGEVRPPAQLDRRLKEAKNLGYENVIYDVSDIGEAVKQAILN